MDEAALESLLDGIVWKSAPEFLAATRFHTDAGRMLSLDLDTRDRRWAALEAERDRLREAYQQVKIELEVLKRRLFVAKAERIDTAQLELELGHSWRPWTSWRVGSARKAGTRPRHRRIGPRQEEANRPPRSA
jgi:hypothetical protein